MPLAFSEYCATVHRSTEYCAWCIASEYCATVHVMFSVCAKSSFAPPVHSSNSRVSLSARFTRSTQHRWYAHRAPREPLAATILPAARILAQQAAAWTFWLLAIRLILRSVRYGEPEMWTINLGFLFSNLIFPTLGLNILLLPVNQHSP